MQIRKLTRHDVEAARIALCNKQKWKCLICKGDLSRVKGDQKKTSALDHCHKTGFVRGVLCINCNGLEGKIKGLAQRGQHTLKGGYLEWLNRLIEYLNKCEKPQTNLIHPKHKTEDEKRIERNRKARVNRARKKGKK